MKYPDRSMSLELLIPWLLCSSHFLSGEFCMQKRLKNAMV